jgi:N4-gp56 family major capsid protein
MSASPMVYGDITPRTAAHAVAKMLARGVPYLVLEKFGQTYVMPNKSTKVAKFRRYNALPLATTPLVEGVTPAGSRVTVTDVSVTLQQYGDFVPFSDVIEDTHEDPFLQQLTEVLGEQAAQTVETLRFNVIKAGTNVFLANGSVRTDVNTPLTLALQRKATRALKRQNAKMITSVVKSTPDFRTEPVEAAFIGLVHPDVENDIRNITGFIPTKQYGTVTPFANEVGAVEDVRYLRSTIFQSFANAGGAAGAMISTGGSLADVYPVLYLAKDAYGIVPLKGKDSLAIMIVNPKPAAGDPLGQRGTAGWKTMQNSVILNDAWMVRAEVAATN